MRVLVHIRPGSATHRLNMAAGGIALRGHVVRWHGVDPPTDAGERPLGQNGSPGRGKAHDSFASRYDHSDVVLGGPRLPASTAVTGWMAQARAMVLSLEPAAVRRWGLID